MPRVQQKRGTAANLTSVNPTLLAGELLVVTDENTLVIGNGSDAYTSLAYVTATPRAHTHPIGDVTGLNISPAGSPAVSYDVALSYNYSSGEWSTKTIGRVGVGSQPIGGWPSGSVGGALAGKASTTHKSTHATGGSDALTPVDIGAAPAASPTFTGNVGIGANPALFNSSFNNLVVGDGSAVEGATIYSTTQGTLAFGDTATNGADGYRGYVAYVHATDYMVLGTGGAERLRIYSSGIIVSGTITVPTGSGSAGSYLPAVVFSGDPNTGIQQIGGADTFSIVTGGIERARVDSAGNVSVGSSSAIGRVELGSPAHSKGTSTAPATSGILAFPNYNKVRDLCSIQSIAREANFLAGQLAITCANVSGTSQTYIVCDGRSDSVTLRTGNTNRVTVKTTGAVRFAPLAADPASGNEAGDVYYNSTDNKLRVYNGTSWVDLH